MFYRNAAPKSAWWIEVGECAPWPSGGDEASTKPSWSSTKLVQLFQFIYFSSCKGIALPTGCVWANVSVWCEFKCGMCNVHLQSRLWTVGARMSALSKWTLLSTPPPHPPTPRLTLLICRKAPQCTPSYLILQTEASWLLPLIELSSRQSDKKCRCQMSRDLSQSPATRAVAWMAIMASAETESPKKDSSLPLLMQFCSAVILIIPSFFFLQVQDNGSSFSEEQNDITMQLTFSGQCRQCTKTSFSFWLFELFFCLFFGGEQNSVHCVAVPSS